MGTRSSSVAFSILAPSMAASLLGAESERSPIWRRHSGGWQAGPLYILVWGCVVMLGRVLTLLLTVSSICLANGAIAETKDIAAVIAQKLNIPAASINVQEMHFSGIQDCEIYDTFDMRMTGPWSTAVARLKDGSLIARTEPHALEIVFAQCVSRTTPVDTLAELVGNFSDDADVRVLHENNSEVAKTLLLKAGVTFAPPQTAQNQETQIIRFLGLDPDGEELFRVEARISGNRVIVSRTPLATIRPQ